ncbi:MAG TPA: MBOAT family O-acyltransferase [Bryobacteraceae bacterium]|nr:MBOAT family O-acyltransferase [Bryobacteraceae bacterium]
MQAGTALYFVFLATVFFLYWGCAGSRLARLTIVLAANFLFLAHYGLFYIFLIPACATIDFTVGLGLMRCQIQAVRRVLVSVSILLNLSLLVGSRHMGWFLAPRWDWVFPLGLSFYTFQSLTYTLDLYRRDAEGTGSLLAHLSAVSFFPTLQAGPITRVAELVKQFAKPPALDRSTGGRAFFLIALGLLKKTLIADFLADNLVNRVFDTPNLYSGAQALLAVYAYSLQLYFDFSGYTDIARGAGLLLGVDLPRNFDRPYLSVNIAEFWRRWHISFSNWLRDYLYFSIPGKRTKVMPYLGLVITMLLGGLWHGVTWNFAIWGLLHGVALAVARWRQVRRSKIRPQPQPSRIGRAAAIFATYQFVCFTWIFFRAGSLAEAGQILQRIGSLTVGLESFSPLLAAVMALAAAALFAPKQWYDRAMGRFASSPFYVHAVALLAVAVAIQLLGGRGSVAFVYSRF